MDIIMSASIYKNLIKLLSLPWGHLEGDSRNSAQVKDHPGSIRWAEMEEGEKTK